MLKNSSPNSLVKRKRQSAKESENVVQLWSQREELWYDNEKRMIFTCEDPHQMKKFMHVILQRVNALHS